MPCIHPAQDNAQSASIHSYGNLHETRWYPRLLPGLNARADVVGNTASAMRANRCPTNNIEGDCAGMGAAGYRYARSNTTASGFSQAEQEFQ